ncbi:hypothetical protein [Actinokineospora sp. NBRC 105648]|uniref:hypothetical protein n=1 Tax=Actinokineospora sp. NBRC 105648 TaxID=3032206 RepID=UPI0024A59677|nr:hypothetical protein [Actinokineospora sp. NBRC 105648]GLZ37799.1 hypothetical protein Acsp05_14240 [Actinokineospora sp. NBRC 105648]
MSTVHAQAEAALPRGLLIAQAWSVLGDAVAPLSNASGRPLARTVKLILDPLVLRPVLNPGFAAAAVRIDHVDALRDRITAAGPVLAATAAWFLVLKKERRRAGITDGNPQDLYFQRCYELATEHGDPGPDRAEVAAGVLAEVHGQDGPTVAQLRDFVADPGHAGELSRLLDAAWADPPQARPTPAAVQPADFLATCPDPDPDLFDALVADLAGTAGAVELDRPGTAMDHGLTDRVQPARPALGDTAAKQSLPKPFDRSIVERLFAALSSASRTELGAVPGLVRREITRSARPWQLGEEPGRVVMVLGREAIAGLDGAPASPGAAARLRSRWEREAYVHRVLRMPSAAPQEVRADVYGVRKAYLRRLWVRLHGRELRRDTVSADGLWDLLDGVLRSVILDQRDRLRSALERQSSEGSP